MLNTNRHLSDSQKFTNTRLGITLTYDTHLEGTFLQGCDLDHSIQNIVRVHPIGGKVDRRHPGLVFPGFLIYRQGSTELVVLLNSSHMPPQMRRELDELSQAAAENNWLLKVWRPEDSATSREYRKLNKKRAGN